MCGITGIVSNQKIDESLLANMARQIKHRGPDHTGTLVENGIGLAMTRLAIIDLSGGVQPMTTKDGQITLIYNGEIYNYKELRTLMEPHFTFNTTSDTEVILNGYAMFGVEIFAKLNGIFGLAIYDRPNHKVILARDPMGVKPLYYTKQDRTIYFSSEIKSFTQNNLANEVNFDAVLEYLSAGYVFHPHTAVKGIVQLDPGHYLEIDNEQSIKT